MKISEAEYVVGLVPQRLFHSLVYSVGTPDIIPIQKSHISPGGPLQTEISGMGGSMVARMDYPNPGASGGKSVGDGAGLIR